MTKANGLPGAEAGNTVHNNHTTEDRDAGDAVGLGLKFKVDGLNVQFKISEKEMPYVR